MNIAVIFAGGSGQRMNTKSKPKQFLELHEKPIIVYTLENFERHDRIDAIIIVCIREWIDYCWKLVRKFNLSKVKEIVPGGETGLLSRYEGVKCAYKLFPDNSLCLLHDGVRPLIDYETITNNILTATKLGSAITVAPVIETIAVKGEGNKVGKIIDRKMCQTAKAPQTFYLRDLMKAHQNAVQEGMLDCIDTAYLMQKYGYELYTVEGAGDNIKITTPMDFYLFRALLDARENSQIFGV